MAQRLGIIALKPSRNLPMVQDDGSIFSYLEKIKKFPVLTEKEELSLLTDFKANHNLEAAHKLVTSHLRLAAKIAFGYRRYGLPIADIISEANIGLMQAVKKFDISKNVRLSTYAIWWIKASINDYVLRSWSLVKIGTVAAQKKLFYNLNRIKSRLGLYDNKALEPSVVREIARELVVEERDVIEMSQRLCGDKSLNVTICDDSEDEKIDLLIDKTQNIEEKFLNRDEARYKSKILHKCLKVLNDREQYIIKNRMLIDNPITLEDLGTQFGISRERVRQIEKRAFERLSEAVRLELK
jgi:RNA polymerase sigma-32 factor